MQGSVNHLLYKEFPSVSVFPFIPREADVEFVLLRDITTGKISEVSGRNSEVDACILFTAARSLLRETNGLFTSTNLTSDGTKELEIMTVSKPELYNCNLILNEPEFDKLLKQFVRTGEHVDLDTDAKVIALPIAPIDLKVFNGYLKKIDHPKEVVIVSASSLSQKQDLGLEPATQEKLNGVIANLFTTIPFVINESKRKHYAVITCFDPATSSRMYDHCEYLVQGSFRRQDESWHHFKAAMGELPDVSLLEKLDGIVVPGAAGSCYDPSLTWIPKLEELIRHVYKNTKIRYLGLCYGAQVMSQALGGKVERNTRVGFKAATENITLNDDFYEAPYVKSLTALYTKRPKTLCIVKSHGDYISKLPEDATLFASSETSKHELFCVGDRFLGTQGHPEYSSDFVCSRDGKVPLSKATDVEISEYEEKKRLRKEKNYSQPEDRFELRSIFMNFFRGIYE